MCYVRVLGKSFKVCPSVFMFYFIVFNSYHYMFIGDIAGVKYNIYCFYRISMVLQLWHGVLFVCMVLQV